MAVEREVLVEVPTDRFDGMKISWDGIFGGVLAGVGTLMLLAALGAAIGIYAADPETTDASTLGTGAAIWTALTLLIALFVAGWAATRLSMLWERTTAMFEGALVWVLSMIVILYLTASGISLMADGAFGLASQAAQTAGSTMGGADIQAMAERAQPAATRTAWITFGALLLSLGASIAGAAAGRRNVVKRATGRV